MSAIIKTAVLVKLSRDGITVAEAARICQAAGAINSHSSLYQWLRYDRDIGVDRAEAIATALGVRVVAS